LLPEIVRRALPEIRAAGLEAFALAIEVTANMADGQPLPPLIENGVVWRLVRRAGGRTAWRRISLAVHG